jgi:hypothetical protein
MERLVMDSSDSKLLAVDPPEALAVAGRYPSQDFEQDFERQ